MAITITQSPAQEDLIGRRLIYSATTTNGLNAGFQFTVVVSSTLGTTTLRVPLNVAGTAIIDVAKLLLLKNQELYSGVSIHRQTAPVQEPTGAGCLINYTVSFQEGWTVAGVYTLQGTPTTVTRSLLWNATLQATDPYSTTLQSRYLLNGQSQRFLSDRTADTFSWLYGNHFGFGPASNTIFIPVRNADWGVLSIAYLTTKTATNLTVTIFESDGTPNSFNISLSTHNQSTMWHYPVFPANLNASSETGWLKPQDYPNWRCITVRAVNGSGSAQSATYVLYNADTYGPKDCIQDNVRLAWKGSGGSWEYVNFIKKSEPSYNIERKQMRKVLGNYGATYTMTGQEAGLTETENFVDQIITANSDYVSEGGFEYLRGLFVSKQVHIVTDAGTHIPVVVEDNNFVSKRTRDGKYYAQSIRIKLSNYLWT